MNLSDAQVRALELIGRQTITHSEYWRCVEQNTRASLDRYGLTSTNWHATPPIVHLTDDGVKYLDGIRIGRRMERGKK